MSDKMKARYTPEQYARFEAAWSEGFRLRKSLADIIDGAIFAALFGADESANSGPNMPAPTGGEQLIPLKDG